MTETETLYFFRALNTKVCEVAKFVDGRKRPDEVYKLYNGSCNCFGSKRGTRECKHVIMYKSWQKLGAKSVAIDYDNSRVYNLEILQ